MANDARTDLSDLPQATPEEIRLLLRRAGLDLPEELLQQFLAAWPAYEAMVRRIPRSRALRRGAGAQLPPVPLLRTGERSGRLRRGNDPDACPVIPARHFPLRHDAVTIAANAVSVRPGG